MYTLYSDRQIALVAESGRIVGETIKLVGAAIRPGITTNELAVIAEKFILEQGGIPAFKNYQVHGLPPFPSPICTSVNDIVVHGVADDIPLKDGDLVSIDVGVQKNNYFGDAAWTFSVGNVDDAAKKLLAVGEESLNRAIMEMRSGNPLYRIGKAVQDYVQNQGFSIIRDASGHGVGLNLHEEPEVKNFVDDSDLLPKNERKLRPGCILAIEPMVNEKLHHTRVKKNEWPVSTLDGGRSVHFEHTVAIDSTGQTLILTKV